MHPFLQFPQLLFLAPLYAPVLLRITVATALFYLAYQQWQRRGEITPVRSSGFPALSIAFNVVVGASLLFGYYAQVAALLAMIGFIIGLWLNRKHTHIVILPSSTVIVLLVISIALIFTGAGTLAMDIPL